MIVLSNEREIINVRDWDEITSRPGFTDALDPDAHTLKTIIGRYQFGERVPCGLSNCQTPHLKGYIVVTNDGRETNIGKDCGKNYFGVDFETLSAQFDRDLTEKENRERVGNFVFLRIEKVAAQVRELLLSDFGGKWVCEKCNSLRGESPGVPGRVVVLIKNLTRNGQTMLLQERNATAEELEHLDLQAGHKVRRPQIVARPVGELSGLDVLAPENDLRQLLVVELQDSLKLLESLSVDTMSFDDLRRWAKWVGEVDGRLERAANVIERARRLLNAQNLSMIKRAVILDDDDLVAFNRFLHQLPRDAGSDPWGG